MEMMPCNTCGQSPAVHVLDDPAEQSGVMVVVKCTTHSTSVGLSKDTDEARRQAVRLWNEWNQQAKEDILT